MLFYNLDIQFSYQQNGVSVVTKDPFPVIPYDTTSPESCTSLSISIVNNGTFSLLRPESYLFRRDKKAVVKALAYGTVCAGEGTSPEPTIAPDHPWNLASPAGYLLGTSEAGASWHLAAPKSDNENRECIACISHVPPASTTWTAKHKNNIPTLIVALAPFSFGKTQETPSSYKVHFIEQKGNYNVVWVLHLSKLPETLALTPSATPVSTTTPKTFLERLTSNVSPAICTHLENKDLLSLSLVNKECYGNTHQLPVRDIFLSNMLKKGNFFTIQNTSSHSETLFVVTEERNKEAYTELQKQFSPWKTPMAASLENYVKYTPSLKHFAPHSSQLSL